MKKFIYKIDFNKNGNLNILVLFLYFFLFWSVGNSDIKNPTIHYFFKPLLLVGFSIELIRRYFLKENTLIHNIFFYVSMFFSVVYFVYSSSPIAYLYLYSFPVSILKSTTLNNKRFLIGVNFIIYSFTVFIVDSISWGLFQSIVFYAVYIYLVHLRFQNRIEREKIKILNEQLKQSNSMLKEYLIKIEGLTKSEERNRIAQELHDSLGHSLMGLSMHLDFTEKIIDSKPIEAKNSIKKCRVLVSNSITNLRETVYSLKQENAILSLENSINLLKEGLSIDNIIDIKIDFDKNIEKSNSIIKEVLYKTIQESLTNSIKHGKSTQIYIKLEVENNFIIAKICDNGIGSNDIIKSNGLSGIEDRIKAINGSVEFVSKNGFVVSAKIPIMESDIDG